MTAPVDELAAAFQLHQAGDLEAAKEAYRRLLGDSQLQPRAAFSLGVIALQSGQALEGVHWFRQAIHGDPLPAEYHWHLGYALASLQRFDQALEAYEQGLQRDRGNAWTWWLYGNALMAKQRCSDAIPAYTEAIKLDPTFFDAYYQLGEAQRISGGLEAALKAYQAALERCPDAAEVLFAVGQCYYQGQRPDLAIPFFERALALQPQQSLWRYALATTWEQLGEIERAQAACSEALRTQTDFAEAHYLLGNLYVMQGRYEEALPCFQRAVESRSNYSQAMTNLGAAYQQLGQENEALAWFQRSLQVDPRATNAWFNIGNLFLAKGKFETALYYFKETVKNDPNHVEALSRLAAAASQLQQFDEAVLALERVIQLCPDLIDAYFRLGGCYRDQQHHDLALKVYERALQISPEAPHVLATLIHQKQTICHWDGLYELSERLLAHIEEEVTRDTDDQIAPFIVICLSKPSTASQQYQAARKYVRSRDLPTAPLHRRPPSVAVGIPHRKLRIGYLSGDFQQHPVGYLVGELFEEHDRDRFRIYGYSYGIEDHSPLRKRLGSSFDVFRDVQSRSFRETAEQIVEDEIDILVDLQGFTARSRTEILLLRPAPIQVNYLGFPGTMGTRAIDYILVDDYIVPPEQQACYTEKLMYLPGCFLVNDSRREIDPRIPRRDSLGLPEDGFVFCAFNSNHKMTREMFEVWMRLLQATPRSVLWLRDSNRFAVENLQHEAKRYGIEENRLVLAPGLPMPKHLARHRAADLFLDTFPYNQHSTAADALRMGLPMVTLSGQTFASRVAGSILRTLELPELITDSHAAYEQVALRLAHDPVGLAAIRSRLRDALQRSDFLDGAAFARKLETAYQTMWTNYLAEAGSQGS
jgi:protein O-GlcNAc transferase